MADAVGAQWDNPAHPVHPVQLAHLVPKALLVSLAILAEMAVAVNKVQLDPQAIPVHLADKVPLVMLVKVPLAVKRAIPVPLVLPAALVVPVSTRTELVPLAETEDPVHLVHLASLDLQVLLPLVVALALRVLVVRPAKMPNIAPARIAPRPKPLKLKLRPKLRPRPKPKPRHKLDNYYNLVDFILASDIYFNLLIKYAKCTSFFKLLF